MTNEQLIQKLNENKEQELFYLEQLMKQNEGLVRALVKQNLKFLKETGSHCGDFEDLYQEGMIGLILAARKFSLDSKLQFTTFAYSYIDGYMKNSIYEMVCDSMSTKVYKQLCAYQKRFPDSKEITDENATIMGWSNLKTKNIRQLQQILQRENICQQERDDLEKTETYIPIKSNIGNPEQILFKKINQKQMHQLLEDTLSIIQQVSKKEDYERNVQFFLSYFGITGDCKSGEEIAKEFGTTRQNVNYVIHKIMNKMSEKKIVQKIREQLDIPDHILQSEVLNYLSHESEMNL